MTERFGLFCGSPFRFHCGKIERFSTVSTEFSTGFAKKSKNRREKARFLWKNFVENPGESVEKFPRCGKPVESFPTQERQKENLL